MVSHFCAGGEGVVNKKQNFINNLFVVETQMGCKRKKKKRGGGKQNTYLTKKKTLITCRGVGVPGGKDVFFTVISSPSSSLYFSRKP